MQLYARPSSWLFAKQVTGDVLMLVGLVVAALAARVTDGVIRSIAEPARQSARLGAEAERHLSDAATQAGGVPLVGDGLRQPLDGLAGSVHAMTGYAQQQVASIELAATVLGIMVFAIPAAVLVLSWVPRRIAFSRLAGETRALSATAAGSELLALRALATQPLAQLQAAASDPVEAWRSGDEQAIARLAELELKRAGVSRPRPRRR